MDRQLKSKNKQITDIAKGGLKEPVLSEQKINIDNNLSLLASMFQKKIDWLSNKEKYLKQHRNLKLQIELVPGSRFGINLRKLLKTSQWNRIRKEVYAKANNFCEICGEQGTKHPVECHEVWTYDDNRLIQKLGSLQAICPLCHEVKHIGFAGVMGNKERAINRFIKINNITEELANNILEAVSEEWFIRSKKKWKIDITLLKKYNIDHKSIALM